MPMKKSNKKAQDFAREAHEEHFKSRRGIWDCGDGIVCYYNNNPYPFLEGMPGREMETAGLRWWLEQVGGEEVGYGEYPSEGVDKGYTAAMLIRGIDQDRLVAQIERITSAVMDFRAA